MKRKPHPYLLQRRDVEGGVLFGTNRVRNIFRVLAKKVLIQLKSGMTLISIAVSVGWVVPLNARRKQRRIPRCKNRYRQAVCKRPGGICSYIVAACPWTVPVLNFANPSAIAAATPFSAVSRATRKAFLIALALERPCEIIATPLMPSRGRPPYSV